MGGNVRLSTMLEVDCDVVPVLLLLLLRGEIDPLYFSSPGNRVLYTTKSLWPTYICTLLIQTGDQGLCSLKPDWGFFFFFFFFIFFSFPHLHFSSLLSPAPIFRSSNHNTDSSKANQAKQTKSKQSNTTLSFKMP